MVKRPLPYVLSQQADHDLEAIFDYTADRFGLDQAAAYVDGFEGIFDGLSNNPHSGRARDEVRTGLRSTVYMRHVVFYRILKDRIRIVRLLHESRDILRYIPPAG